MKMKRKTMTAVYPLRKEIPKHDDTRIRITGNTFQVMEELPTLFIDAGKIIEVIHYKKNGQYLTFFVGQKFNIVVEDGLTSGYVGVGTNRFIEVLESLGMEKNEAESIIHAQQNYEGVEIVISFH